MKVDITYTNNGIWTRFYGESEQGEQQVEEIRRVTGDNVLRNDHAKKAIKELRGLGYVIKKAKKPTQEEIDAILEELDV